MATDNSTKIVITAEDRTAAGLRSAQTTLSNFANTTKTIAAGIGVAAIGSQVLSMAKSAIDAGDQLNKLAQKTGIAVEKLSELKYAGELSDVSLEALAGGVKKLAVNMNEVAAGGSGDAAAAFRAIGVSVKTATGDLRSSDDVLADIAERFAQMEDGAGKTALAVAIFGKSGADLIPFLNLGAKGLDNMATEARQLGLVMTGDFAKASEEFNDNMTRLIKSVEGFKIALAGGLIQDLVKFTDALVASAKATGNLASGFMLLGGSQANDPASGLVEVEKRLESLKKTREELTGSFVGRNMPMFVAEDVKILDTQIAFAQKQKQALSELVGKAAAKAEEAANQKPKIAAPVFSGGKDKDGTTKADPYATLLKQIAEKNAALALEAQSTERLTQAQQFALKVMTDLQGGYLDITGAQKQALAGKLEELLANDQLNQATEERRKQLEREGKAAEEYFREEEKARLVVEDYIAGNRALIERTEQRRALIGLSEREIQIVEALRQAEDEAAAARRNAFRDIADPQLLQETLQGINTALEQQKQQLADVTGAVYDYATSWEAGTRTALAGYIDEVSNAARASEQLVTKSFKGMEDALVDFVKTGKLDFRGLADSIISDMIRIQVQQSITKPLAQMASGASDSIGGFLKGLFGGGRATGGPVSPGQFYVVGEKGPEILVPNSAGTVIPNGAAMVSGGQTVVIHQTIAVDSRSDRGTIIAAMVQAKEAAKAEILDSMRRGGTFSRA